jgi:hypothetical protein
VTPQTHTPESEVSTTKEPEQSTQEQEISSTPEVETLPETISIELTPKAYSVMKEAQLGKVSPAVRPHLETWLEWLQTISPDDVMDAIEQGTSLKEAYDHAPYKWRLAVATARGFLKTYPKYKRQFKDAISLELALTTLKFENPNVFSVLEHYGQKGTDYIDQCIKDTFQIFGVIEEVKPNG